jgi:hypothetical protein
MGMMITEATPSICGRTIMVGSYGFGLNRPARGSEADAIFNLYNQAGAKVVSCVARRDARMAQPKPLQVILSSKGTARLYLGRYWLEIR